MLRNLVALGARAASTRLSHLTSQAAVAAATHQHRLFSTAPAISTHVNFIWARQRLAQLPRDCYPIFCQFDSAGTLIQPYCFPPLIALYIVFKRRGVELTPEQITGPMGKSKPEHILELIETHHLNLNLADIVNEFNIELDRIIGDDTEVIPYASDLLTFIGETGSATALTSGYFKNPLEKAIVRLKQIHTFDAITAADDLPEHSRSRYDLLLENIKKRGLSPTSMASNIFFTDTSSDVQSVGRRAFVVGVRNHSSLNSIATPAALKLITPTELAKRRQQTEERLYKAGAHIVIPDLSYGPLAILTVAQARSQKINPTEVHRLELMKPDQDIQQQYSYRRP